MRLFVAPRALVRALFKRVILLLILGVGGELDVSDNCSSDAAIAVYAFHDASVALSCGGQVQCVLELERLFEVRYFLSDTGSRERFRADWLVALRAVRDRCECEGGACPSRFRDGVLVVSGKYAEEDADFKSVVGELFVVEKWHKVNHHHAHSLLGYFASPFRSALVVSFDGGGNDGSFNAYIGVDDRLTFLRKLSLNMGKAYTFLSLFLPEVTGEPIDGMCYKFMNSSKHRNQVTKAGRPRWTNVGGMWNNSIEGRLMYQHKWQSFPGKLMGYAATGTASPETKDRVRDFFAHGSWTLDLHRDIVRLACRSVEDQRDLAAAFQVEFEKFVHLLVTNLLVEARARLDTDVDGVVLTGGCALNVLANQFVHDKLGQLKSPLSVYVPTAPHDGGLVVGGLWMVQPPTQRQPLQYLGFRLWDDDVLAKEASRRGARNLTLLGGVEYLAELLAGGDAWLLERGAERAEVRRPIVAVVRGRQEYGPRALGHRSLLASPDVDGLKERLNRLKFREWYRPVAPMIADEALEEVFGRKVASPYMSMAPRVRPDIERRFPALAHLDGTARHQSVGKEDEPWVHALLHAVGRRIGLATLINTSFNSKGKPIANTVLACLQMLDELPDLDFVLIEDWLFRKAPRDVLASRSASTLS
eukprot:TRINITY_DN38702_c0_g1_i1.p1 TRINITY_DN38702_c0_g1~~TRINITY_DN38702_c0_g1_i1.p1  ORF type:complete len:645 (-),score=127.58 TRINITY_DN38702_c0_g1_i1:19-1953(-)